MHAPPSASRALPPIRSQCLLFFFNDTATTEIYTLSLHDALPISTTWPSARWNTGITAIPSSPASSRSEEHTSELQSQSNLVCRLLLEKKNSPTNPQRLPTRFTTSSSYYSTRARATITTLTAIKYT